MTQAETWRWGSLWHRAHGTAPLLLQPGPLPLPEDWLSQVAEAKTEPEMAALRRSVTRGSPRGDEEWRQRTALALVLESTLRARGCPRLQMPNKK